MPTTGGKSVTNKKNFEKYPTSRLFLLADGAGLYVFGYEGRLVCELKLPNSALGAGHHDRYLFESQCVCKVS